jgi:hypothetical protein
MMLRSVFKTLAGRPIFVNMEHGFIIEHVFHLSSGMICIYWSGNDASAPLPLNYRCGKVSKSGIGVSPLVGPTVPTPERRNEISNVGTKKRALLSDVLSIRPL